MSLADQSQQWFPTGVQVTVHQARNLRAKGKHGTNDAYAIMQVAKDKFSTSVSEKCVDPVWKEEASFDLPLFHPSNGDRCTLYVQVMHRAQVGLDKFLGQAVVNLLDLHNSPCKKTDWFKMVDKTGKEDKVRGELLLDIQFVRNNMSASMLDLSMLDKPRSRISKLKDKVRGKKKDGFSDSASAIVPSVSKVLTDSEGEVDTQSLNQSEGVKKKSKLKSLFAPKSNLQRNISQSMSTLGTLPEKNSSLSGSRSSGLNVDSPDVKKKFKFLGHKRTASSDSKHSLGPLSILGRPKQSNSDLNSLCINGSHVYAEDTDPHSGSTISLNSSGQGSVEDIRKHTSEVSADSFISVPVPSFKHESSDKEILEQQRHQEEERRQEEDRHTAEAKRLQEEEEHRRQEEQERKRHFIEDEARRKQQSEEEEERRKQEEAAEYQKLEEEQRRSAEQKRQEEASMSDRLSSLFGMIRKKEEKKEELPITGDPDKPISNPFINSFEIIDIGNDNETPADHQKSSGNPQYSAMGFLNRTAKVSAVKPRDTILRLARLELEYYPQRYTQSLESEPAECQTPSQLCPSPATSESSLSNILFDSPDTFSSLHSSLAPPNISQSPSGSPRGSREDLTTGFVESSPMAERRRALMPSSYTPHGTQTGGNTAPVREITNPGYVEKDDREPARKMSIPLPDYDTLFPHKRHGVQGHTRWDHIIAEVNQKHRDFAEMSVDAPEENKPRFSLPQESPMTHYQTQSQPTKPMSSKKAAAPTPPKSVAPPDPRSVADSSQTQSQNTASQSLMKPNLPTVPEPVNTRESLSEFSRFGARRVSRPSPGATHAPRSASQMGLEPTTTTTSDDEREVQVPVNMEAPTVKPRQRGSGKEPVQQEYSAVTPVVSDKYMNSDIQILPSSGMSSTVTGEPDPFPITELLSRDPWAQPMPNQEVDPFSTGSVQNEQKVEDRGMTPGDLDHIFNQEKQPDFFADFNGSDSNKHTEYLEKNEDSNQVSPVFQGGNSQRPNQSILSTTHLDNKTARSQEPTYKEEPTITTAYQVPSALSVRNGSNKPKPSDNVKTQNTFYGSKDQFGAEPFSSMLTSSEPLKVVIEEVEPASQAGGLSGGNASLQAWRSPSDVQPVSAVNSNGGGLALTPRRPHPVKPMSLESLHPISTTAVKEIKGRKSTPGTHQVANLVDSGPFTQLTQEELITLVVRQQADLSKKDSQIVELEEYIDNLLVRVIDEQPGILQSLNSGKQ